MNSQVLHTVWCNIPVEAAGEIWHWSPLAVNGLKEWSPIRSAIIRVITEFIGRRKVLSPGQTDATSCTQPLGSCCNILNRVGQTNATLCNMVASCVQQCCTMLYQYASSETQGQIMGRAAVSFLPIPRSVPGSPRMTNMLHPSGQGFIIN